MSKSNSGQIVYSTNPNFKADVDEKETVTPPPSQQKLKILTDRKNRGGKTVTLIQGFTGKQEDLEALCKMLKNKCGTGGSAKDGEIIIQGDVKEKIKKILSDLSYQVKVI